MKASYKMKRGIEQLEKKYGKLNINYGVEPIEQNRRGNGFYDYAEVTCNILNRLWVINHEGEIF